tara:strand:- start:85084 stop:85266 length:183 start_codon:yes stop_codon:yes gene_type:complete
MKQLLIKLHNDNTLALILLILAIPFLACYVAIGYKTGIEIDWLAIVAGVFIITGVLLLKN